jgi:DNA-binding GntR family transcriptional regulator
MAQGMTTGAASITPLADRPSLRVEILGALRAALISGRMRPGVVYSVPLLAAEFGVSATPVREAMLDLAKEGLVEAIRNRGFRVTEPTDRVLDEITELRALIEVPTVVGLAETAQPDLLEALRPVAQEIIATAREHDLAGYLESDRRFHLQLLALSGNEQLVETVRRLRDRTRLYGLEELMAQGRLLASAEEHVELLDALLARDTDRAREVMARHIGHIRGIWAARPDASGSAEPAERAGLAQT